MKRENKIESTVNDLDILMPLLHLLPLLFEDLSIIL